MTQSPRSPLLTVRNLNVAFARAGHSPRQVIKDLSLTIERGRIFALVGESGSGKTLFGRSLLGLLPATARCEVEKLTLDGIDLANASPLAWRSVRGRKVGLIFQEPMVSLNPSLKIGAQIGEAMRLHTDLSAAEIARQACDLLRRVRVPDPEAALERYPHEFSGGIRQRVMLASVLLPRPSLLIADEPTTALDVLVQKDVLDVLVGLVREIGTTVLFITHDLGLVAKYADDVAVMRNGEIVETGTTGQVLSQPKHGYTRSLLASVSPKREMERQCEGRKTLLTVREAQLTYSRKAGLFRQPSRFEALKRVSLDVYEGETLAIVGESGSGKTSLGRAMLGLVDLSGGSITFDNVPIRRDDKVSLKRVRGRAQMIFQDPYSSLNPRLRAIDAVGEGLLRGRGTPRHERLAASAKALQEVGLDGLEDRYPHQLSGGQRQRLCIARAMITNPAFIVADEPVAALDATIQSQILDLLADLKRRHSFTCVFISHDLGAVRRIANRVGILYRGELVEMGTTEQIFANPQHPYTRALLEARPLLRPNDTGGFELAAR